MFERFSAVLLRRALRWCAAPLLLFALPVSAGPIDPPLELLHSSSSVLIAGKLARIDADGRLEFTVRDTLSGTPPQEYAVDIGFGSDVPADLRVGHRYIVGYTILIRDPHNRKHKLPNPQGPTVLSSPGLEPALFEDSRALRAILRASDDEEGRESQELLDLLLKAIAGSEPQLQNLAAYELAYRPDLAARLDARGRTVLGTAAKDADARPAARSALLQASFHDPDRYGDWWRPAAQNIVTTTPVDGYIAQSEGLDALVMAAFGVLQAGEVDLPSDALVRWVGGVRPAISERALLMLRKQEPRLERSSIQQALANPALPTQTRTFLTDHLRRLDFMEKKLRESANGKATNAAG